MQTHHVEWEGCVFWDLIQPSFMFMVGVAMPFAFQKRESLGQSPGKRFAHVVKRAIYLCLFAIGFDSIQHGSILIGFVNVLPQIAFGYVITYLVMSKSYRFQAIFALALVALYSLVWIVYPGNGSAGLWANPRSLPPWGEQFANLASDFDFWMLGRWYPDYWVALNAIPSTATIIAGAMCGKFVAGNPPPKRLLGTLLASAAALILVGLLISFSGIPIIKRILTASFALYSTGWSILFLSLFYVVVDLLGYRKWAYPLIVVGMNSMAAYFMYQLFHSSIDNAVMVFFQTPINAMGNLGQIVRACLVLAVVWYILHFFYKRKIFFKV